MGNRPLSFNKQSKEHHGNTYTKIYCLFIVIIRVYRNSFLILNLGPSGHEHFIGEVLDDMPKVGAQLHWVYGVKGNESCDNVMQLFHLSNATFHIFNYNLNCDDLYRGQWLCVKNMTLY